MFSSEIIFSSYTLIGLTLFILSASAALYLLSLPNKTRPTLALIGFLLMIAFSGLATILANSWFTYDRLFMPWQDFWILAGGLFLVIFTYSIGGETLAREGWIVLLLMGGLTAAALSYCIGFDYRYLTQWTPQLDVSDGFYLLLPLGTLFMVVIMLRRALYFSKRAAQAAGPLAIRAKGQLLLHPQGAEARTLRNFALALSLAFLPGLQTLITLPGLYGFLLSNAGAILAIVAMNYVYFNYAPEVTSFLAKLVGITLAFVLLILTIFGTIDFYLARQDYEFDRLETIAAIRQAVLRTEDLVAAPLPVAYLVAWDANAPRDSASFRLIYLSKLFRQFDLAQLLANNGPGPLEAWAQPLNGRLTDIGEQNWWIITRDLSPTPGDSFNQFYGYIFDVGDTAYEVGFPRHAIDIHTSPVALSWLLVMLVSSALILLAFPHLFRTLLVRPLQSLLAGMQQVNDGHLDTEVPVIFRDEIGFLTQSFNDLTHNLQASQSRQRELYGELQQSYTELEDRVAERTRELAAFTDLTMLSGDQDNLPDIVQPVLGRIIELNLCHALALHLLAEDGKELALIAQQRLPQGREEGMSHLRPSKGFGARIQEADAALLFTSGSGSGVLPKALRIPEYPTYLGCALMAGEQSHGWLSCYRPAGERFSRGEQSLLLALARQIGVIVENHQLRQKLNETAVTVERQRLGRDLHDSVTQLLYSMTLFSRSAKEAVEDGDEQRLQRSLDQLIETALLALREMRFLLFELLPPAIEEAGLAKALDTRLNMVERRVGIQVGFIMDETFPRNVNWEQELYYVAIEALNNALKHAHADRVDVTLRRDNGRGLLIVADNGRGFDLEQVSPGMGLRSMRQRVESLGGELCIDSSLNIGTKITARLPLSG